MFDALRAADELIWSCLQVASLVTETPLPLPLPYPDAAFSPSATPRIKPPPTLPARDRVLDDMLRILPVPMIALPYGIVEEPWWLVLVAHEVGHHVQYDLDSAAVKETGAILKREGGAEWESWRFVVADVSRRKRAACHAHLRRYFHEALPTAPIAQEGTDLILGLYRVEHAHR